MPQMSPMPWIMLLMTSLFMIMFFSTILYFSFTTSLKTKKNNDNKFIFNIWSYSKF